MKTSPAITLAVTAALLTGCAASPDTTQQRSPMADPGHTRAQAASKDPVEFGKTFVAAAYTWDTRTNTDLTAALKRLENMATGELAAQFVAPQNAAKGAIWNQATTNQAHTEPKVTKVPEGNQALMRTRPGTTKAAYMVTWKWTGAGGYRQDGGKELVILTLVNTEDGWKVASFEPTPLQLR